MKRSPQEFNDDVWYFAYGSNMDCDRKEERTGAIREARVARLVGYRLAFNKRGSGREIYANVMDDDPNGIVWGVAYRCRPAAIEQLDVYEGVRAGHYERAAVKVETTGGERLDAIAYVALPEHVCAEGTPSAKYLRHLLVGARQHGLPSDYIAWIEQLGGQGRGAESE